MKAKILQKRETNYLIRESGQFLYCPFSERPCSDQCPLFILNEKKVFLMCKNIYYDIVDTIKGFSLKRDLNDILKDISVYFGIQPETIKSDNREARVCIVRHAFVYIAVVKEGYLKKDISNFIKRQRSAISLSLRNIKNLLETRPKDFKGIIDYIENYK